LEDKRDGQPDNGRLSGRFGWPEGARLRYYDEEGNPISKEEWRELGRRKAQKRRRRIEAAG
jgi:hypothetical protein